MSGTTGGAQIALRLKTALYTAADLGIAGLAEMLIDQDYSYTFSNGTGSGQISQIYQDTGSLGASATANIDLAGSLTNIFGATITFTKIKFILLQAAAANNVANNLQLTRGSSNGFVWFLAASDGFYLAPGAVNFWYDPVGIAVTAGTGDILTLTNGAGTNTIAYNIVIGGTD